MRGGARPPAQPGAPAPSSTSSALPQGVRASRRLAPLPGLFGGRKGAGADRGDESGHGKGAQQQPAWMAAGGGDEGGGRFNGTGFGTAPAGLAGGVGRDLGSPGKKPLPPLGRLPPGVKKMAPLAPLQPLNGGAGGAWGSRGAGGGSGWAGVLEAGQVPDLTTLYRRVAAERFAANGGAGALGGMSAAPPLLPALQPLPGRPTPPPQPPASGEFVRSAAAGSGGGGGGGGGNMRAHHRAAAAASSPPETNRTDGGGLVPTPPATLTQRPTAAPLLSPAPPAAPHSPAPAHRAQGGLTFVDTGVVHHQEGQSKLRPPRLVIHYVLYLFLEFDGIL